MIQRTTDRTTDRFEKKREAILDATTRLLNAKGVKGLTLAEAAGAVDLSTTSVTYYFKRKDDLAGAAMLRGVEIIETMARQALKEADPPARLRRFVDLYVGRLQAVAEGRAAPLPSLSDLRALKSPALEDVAGAYLKLFRKLRQIFEAPELSLSRGKATARTHLLLEQVFWSAAWLPTIPTADYAAAGDAMTDILVNGVATPRDVWAPAPIPLKKFAPPLSSEPGRETFLLAATKLINARGYRGASVEKISASLGVTKGSFYHHIDAKDDLVEACFERTFEIIRRALAVGESLPADGWTKLSSVCSAIAEFQLSAQGPLLRATAFAALPEALRTQTGWRAAEVGQGFARMITEGMADGSIRPVHAQLAATMVNAALNAAAELGFWVPGVNAKAAPAIFVRPLLMGSFGA